MLVWKLVFQYFCIRKLLKLFFFNLSEVFGNFEKFSDKFLKLSRIWNFSWAFLQIFRDGQFTPLSILVLRKLECSHEIFLKLGVSPSDTAGDFLLCFMESFPRNLWKLSKKIVKKFLKFPKFLKERRKEIPQNLENFSFWIFHFQMVKTLATLSSLNKIYLFRLFSCFSLHLENRSRCTRIIHFEEAANGRPLKLLHISTLKHLEIILIDCWNTGIQWR